MKRDVHFSAPGALIMQVSFLFYRMLVVDGHRRSLFTSEVGLMYFYSRFFVARSDTKALAIT